MQGEEQWCPVLFPDPCSRDVKVCCCKSELGKAAGCTKRLRVERDAACQLSFFCSSAALLCCFVLLSDFPLETKHLRGD